MNVDVALLFDQQSDLDANRSALHLFRETKPLHNFVHTCAAMRPACCQTHVLEGLPIRNGGLFGFTLRAFNPGATTDNGAIQHTRKRQVNNANNTFAVFDEAYLHGEVAIAVDESGRAVEWIDHPDARLAETAFSIN